MGSDHGALVSEVRIYAHALRGRGIGGGDFARQTTLTRGVSLIDVGAWIGIGVYFEIAICRP